MIAVEVNERGPGRWRQILLAAVAQARWCVCAICSPKSDGRRNLRPPWGKAKGNPQGRPKRAYLEAMRASAEAEGR